MLIGAAAGALISGSVSLYHESKSAGGISNMTADNWKNVGISAGVGGICGGIGGGFGALGASATGSLLTSSAASPLIASTATNTLGYAVGTGMAGGMAGSYTSTATQQILYGYNDPYELMQNTAVGGITGGGFGALGYKVSNPYQKVNKAFYKTNSQVGRSLKPQSEPNTRTNLYSEEGTLKQSRFYGENGKVFLDIDYAHSNADNSHKFPHYHDWDWTKKPPRQKGKW